MPGTGITIGGIQASRGSATVYCGNPRCYRFRHGATRSLKLETLPPQVTVDDVKAVLRCDACDMFQAQIVVTMGPRGSGTLDRDQMRQIFR